MLQASELLLEEQLLVLAIHLLIFVSQSIVFIHLLVKHQCDLVNLIMKVLVLRLEDVNIVGQCRKLSFFLETALLGGFTILLESTLPSVL